MTTKFSHMVYYFLSPKFFSNTATKNTIVIAGAQSKLVAVASDSFFYMQGKHKQLTAKWAIHFVRFSHIFPKNVSNYGKFKSNETVFAVAIIIIILM